MSDDELKDVIWEAEQTSFEYEPWDRDAKLGTTLPYDVNLLDAWQRGHGHDVRLKCYPEFECQVTNVPYLKAILELAKRLGLAP